MRIALFDYRVTATNPVGSCHLRLLQGLCRQHDFTVFAVEFENPCPERIRWVRIRLPVRPYVLLYALFHLTAPLVYAWWRVVKGARFDLVQIVESNLMFGDVSYSHFCHRLYLARHWKETAFCSIDVMKRCPALILAPRQAATAQARVPEPHSF